MIDNFETFKTLLKFPRPDSFYFIQIIQRKKDNSSIKHDHNNVKKIYTVGSIEEYDKIISSIKRICEYYNARAYIHPSSRTYKSIALNMLSNLAEFINKDDYHGLESIFASSCGRCAKGGDPLWIVDLDYENTDLEFEEYASKVSEIINQVRGAEGEKILLRLSTPNGRHFISRPFDVKRFNDLCYEESINAPDIHKNNPTVLYIPDFEQKESLEDPFEEDSVNTPLNILEKWRSSFFKDNIITEGNEKGFKVTYCNGVTSEFIFDGNTRSIDIHFGGKFKFPESIDIHLSLNSLSLEGDFIHSYNRIMETLHMPLVSRKKSDLNSFLSCVKDMVEYYLGSVNNEADIFDDHIIWFGRIFKDLYSLPNIVLWVSLNKENDFLSVNYIDEKEVPSKDRPLLKDFIRNRNDPKNTTFNEYVNWLIIPYGEELEDSFVKGLNDFFSDILTKYLREPLKVCCHNVLEWRFR